jgi:hypothetical protein
MRGIYGHVTPAMRDVLNAAFQDRWDRSIQERASISPHSIVRTLDTLLPATQGSRPRSAPNPLSNCCGHLLTALGLQITYPEAADHMKEARAFMRRPQPSAFGLTVAQLSRQNG